MGSLATRGSARRLLARGFEADHTVRANSGGVVDGGGQLQAVARPQFEGASLVGKREADVALDDVQHLDVAVAVFTIGGVGAIGPAVRLEPLGHELLSQSRLIRWLRLGPGQDPSYLH